MSSQKADIRWASNAEQWVDYIRRGASGKGARGTESTGEYLVIQAAGTLLPSGDPALYLLHRFSIDELADLQKALDIVGMDVWYHGLKQRLSSDNEEIEAGHRERQLVRHLLDGTLNAKTLAGSTSQMITAFLAVGRYESLPEPYKDHVDAWDSLNEAQRLVVREFNYRFRGANWAKTGNTE